MLKLDEIPFFFYNVGYSYKYENVFHMYAYFICGDLEDDFEGCIWKQEK